MVFSADLRYLAMVAMVSLLDKETAILNSFGELSDGCFDFSTEVSRETIGVENFGGQGAVFPSGRDVVKLHLDVWFGTWLALLGGQPFSQEHVNRGLQPFTPQRRAIEIVVLRRRLGTELEFIIDHSQAIFLAIVINSVHAAANCESVQWRGPIRRQSFGHVDLDGDWNVSRRGKLPQILGYDVAKKLREIFPHTLPSQGISHRMGCFVLGEHSPGDSLQNPSRLLHKILAREIIPIDEF